MIQRIIDDLSHLHGVVPCHPISHLELEEEVQIPSVHLELLNFANGMMVYGGYYRLFGIGCISCIDMSKWNLRETWKFAWPGHVDEYWCFGENAFGAQYAYLRSDLAQGNDAKVYFLEHMTMTPEPLAPNFETFLESEFLRCARDPFYQFHKLTRKGLGDLHWGEHVTMSHPC
jgi:hypothetical protein